ncbi:response regulator transcription factor [Paraburkholderia fynbosensis]|uniref:C4-dicarboxylate transport transcriptional regulatory protein DctD n=1 Tax=Paraburkholderia fynbosensis TaxID=1200993 RepID=A0A6J5H484_9BURK|nr:response regulator [Paraburkholderia fynbosensis]CAB3810253.1 C4-dicarboxylate transport transcriptional regulatory protein DctD [Paraburkholderia fynbosensis]
MPNLIVIIEDDAGLRRAVERLLSVAGFVARSFGSAEEPGAVESASAADCLILDMQLPGLSGFAFYETLGAPRPPVVFTTAFDSAATREAVERAGPHAALIKPFLGMALLDAVRNATRGPP